MRDEGTGLLGGHRRAGYVWLTVMLIAFAVAPVSDGRARQASPAASPAAGQESIEITGLVQQPASLTVADLQGLPTETVDVVYEASGTPEEHTFTGTSLYGVIEEVGLDVPADARNPLLGMYLIVTAKDGYQVVISGGEIDPSFGNAPMLLAWEQDGQPLSDEDGPVRLVVPGDTRGGRYVYGVIQIDVRSIEEAGGT